MSRLERQMEECRRLRDEARALLRTEFEHAKDKVAPSALGERLADTVGGKAAELGERAGELADRHGRKVAVAGIAAAGAVGLWLARKPILSGIEALRSRYGGNFDGGTDETRNEETEHE